MNHIATKDLTKMGILTALTFLATYIIKIPSINGYTHLGDCMILISVLILGWKKSALVGGVGASLADLLGGYTQWILPTFVIKACMAVVMGIAAEKIFQNLKFGWIIGAVAGGIIQILGYTVVKILYYGFAAAMVMTPSLIFQTIAGIVIAAIFVSVLNTSGIIKIAKEI